MSNDADRFRSVHTNQMTEGQCCTFYINVVDSYLVSFEIQCFGSAQNKVPFIFYYDLLL